MSGQFEVSKTSNDKFMFNLKAGNGAIVLTSQPYEAMETGIASVAKNAPGAPTLDLTL
jgi:uncharacterized protein YegP (UPF0339 family)